MRNSEYDGMDRATKAYHEARSHETWFGLVLQMSDKGQILAIKTGLNRILAGYDEKPSVSVNSPEIYLKGAYPNKLLEQIEDYLTKQNISYLIGEGSYTDFIGWKDWIKEMKDNQRKRA